MSNTTLRKWEECLDQNELHAIKGWTTHRDDAEFTFEEASLMVWRMIEFLGRHVDRHEINCLLETAENVRTYAQQLDGVLKGEAVLLGLDDYYPAFLEEDDYWRHGAEVRMLYEDDLKKRRTRGVAF